MVVSIQSLNKFFASNVCIPKGEILQVKLNSGWMDMTIHKNLEYRVKPSESIYEWQWLDISNSKCAELMNNSKHMTEDEVKIWISNIKPIKIEETKRERSV